MTSTSNVTHDLVSAPDVQLPPKKQVWIDRIGVLGDSPFGTIIILLSATLSGMTIYHVILFLLAPESLLLDTLRSALYTILAVFLWLVIATHQHIKQTASGG